MRLAAVMFRRGICYPDDMRILPVEPDHIPALSALAGETFSETFGHLYPPEDLADFLTGSYAVAKLAAEVADPAQYWRMVVDEQGYAVAYVQCGPVSLPHPEADPAHEGELKRIYVRASHQGHGLGRRLIDAALAWMVERYGGAAISLDIFRQRVAAACTTGRR